MKKIAATRKKAIINLDRVCENVDLAKLAGKMVTWEKYAPYFGLSPAEEMDIKHDTKEFVVEKRRMLEQWKQKSGEHATYRNLARIFARVGDQMLANFVHHLAQDQGQTEAHNQDQGEAEPHSHDPGEAEPHSCSITRWKLAICFASLILMVLIAAIIYNRSVFSHQPLKYSVPSHYALKYAQYVDNVKQRYKKHLRDVAQSFWLPADMHTFIQLSLKNRDKLGNRSVDECSANPRIVSEQSMTFDYLLSEIDISPGSRILVVGQPGIGKTTLLQMITRYWAHDKALSSCWILLHIFLRDLVLLQHAPNLTTFLSFTGNIWLPPDIETHVLESEGKGLCFIADGLDEYPAGYEDKTNFIFSLIRAQKLAQSTVVISSRPEITSQVWYSFEKRVEVLGFGDDQINEYVQAKYGEDKSFSKYLDDHPRIKHTCYIPLHLAMLVYLKDSVLDTLPETETEMYEQCIIHTLIWDFCKNDTSCSSKNTTLPTSLNNVGELNSPGIESLFHIANLSYSGIQKRQSSFNENEVESVLWSTNTSLLVVDKMSVHKPAIYSFPHLTIQEFLAAFYFNTYLNQQEQKRVLVEYSKHQRRHIFWRFCCGLKRNENKTTFLEFFNLLYQNNNGSKIPHQPLPYHCAHEAKSQITSQQLINFTGGIAELNLESYYDAASFAFVAVSAAENLLEMRIGNWVRKYQLLYKLCDITTNYSQLRKVRLTNIGPSNIGCLLQKSPNLESLTVDGWMGKMYWNKLQSEDAAALLLPPYGTKLLNIRHIDLYGLNIGDEGVKKLAQLLQDSVFLEQLSLSSNRITDEGASTIADLMTALPHLQYVNLNGNHIGETGAALLRNQSIHKCCNIYLKYNVIYNDRPDAFVSALIASCERDKSCQIEVERVVHNQFLCSDLRDIPSV